jgi:hypothetical protein
MNTFGKQGQLNTCKSSIAVYESPPENGAARTIFNIDAEKFWIDEESTGKKLKRRSLSDQPYLILGFDTEFKTPEYHVNREDINAGGAKYRVLSYQFHAKTSSGEEWQGICCTEKDERMTIAEFLVFALAKGSAETDIAIIPTTIFLVGHFTRADIPAFSDFKDQTQLLSSVRNTFVNIEHSIPITINHETGKETNLKVVIRDTMLLTPQSAKSLRGIGELVGLPKLQLGPDEKSHKWMIANMDVVRGRNWEEYKSYALMDATICVRYTERIIEQYERVTGNKKLPVTLTSIGVDLLLKSWHDVLNINYLDALGKEIVKEKIFRPRLNYFVEQKTEADVEELHHHVPFITECYHGGRNEQYWFGPGLEDNWLDVDLASAYPTAMSMIGLPSWRQIRDVKNLKDFTPTTLGFAWVDFKFPANTRFPTLPVRTDNGLVFPLEGTSYCAAPELAVARELGCEIKFRKGVIIPTDPNVLVFGEFIRDCVNKRKEVGSKSFEGLFWKEVSNSTYGKTAQGLRKKRVYDLRDQKTKELPPSRITNPCFAAFITSFARALLGEIMNKVPAHRDVFSCTTDGFITNTSKEELPSLTNGDLGIQYAATRKSLVGDDQIVEIKHEIKQPLGWRTRGQATLKSFDHLANDDKGIVLAKGGIFTKAESETTEQRNEEITRLFFSRTPNSMIVVQSLTGVRDMVEHDADLVPKEINKRLSMEYDWKRQPLGADFNEEYSHVFFRTRPWKTVDQFKTVRILWDDYCKTEAHCIKTVSDFDGFADHVQVRGLDPEKTKYLRKEQPDISRLRQLVCQAWHQGEAGLIRDKSVSASSFALILVESGIPCSRSDVENGKKFVFQSNTCPPTGKVKVALTKLKARFPSLKEGKFLINQKSRDSVTIKPTDIPTSTS